MCAWDRRCPCNGALRAPRARSEEHGARLPRLINKDHDAGDDRRDERERAGDDAQAARVAKAAKERDEDVPEAHLQPTSVQAQLVHVPAERCRATAHVSTRRARCRGARGAGGCAPRTGCGGRERTNRLGRAGSGRRSPVA